LKELDREDARKTWWDCVKDDMESLGLSQKMRSPGINGDRELRGQPANPVSPGKMAIKTVCVYLFTGLLHTK